jgi:hypothetical protein
MKKILQLLGLTIISSSAFAQTQVPNADFENWTLYKPAYNYYAANDWSDGAACLTPQGGTESCQFVNRRTTNAQSGTYALQHFDIAYTSQGGSGVNALPFWNLDETFNGVAFTGRPTSVSFYYKYTTDDNEPMSIDFTLYSGDFLSDATLIGTASFEFSTVQSTYKKVDLDFTYTSTDVPTNIFIKSDFSGSSTPKTALDTLTWDNIVFNYTTTDVTDKSSPDYFTVSTSNKVLSTSRDIHAVTILDYTGRTVASFENTSSNFDVAQLKTGIYILTGTINTTPFSRKIIIE